MPLAKCPRCKKMFNKSGSLVCPKCQPQEDEDADNVRQAVEEHPNLSAEGVSELTGVDVQVVMRMIDSGAIASTITLDGLDIKCGRCGAPAISASKKLCQGCLEKLNAEVAVAQRSVKLDLKKAPQIGTYNMNVRQTLDDKKRK